jgi:predicted MPP superfamily phosphohydrolase
MSFWLSLAIFALMAALDAVWWVTARRLIKRRRWRVPLDLFMAVQTGYLLAIIGHFDWVDKSPQPVLVAVALWHHLGLFLAGAILLPLGLVRLHAGWVRVRLRMTGIGRDKTGAGATVSRPAVDGRGSESALSRREFLGTATALAPAVVTLGLTGVAAGQLNHFRIRRLTLALPTLPRALDGMTIAQVSDIHVGVFTKGAVLREMVSATNALGADLVLMTGDLINYELSDLNEGLALLRAMPGRYGQWMIEGNHDLFDDATEFERRVKASGVPCLLNQSAITMVRGHPVQFFGLRWMEGTPRECDRSHAFWVRELLKQRHPEAFPILLAHHPHAFDAAVAADLPLTLSGHTHGGYLMLTDQIGVGPMLFRYWSGLYQRGRSQMIVSNGVGNPFPLRINAPAEIVHLTLRCAAG